MTALELLIGVYLCVCAVAAYAGVSMALGRLLKRRRLELEERQPPCI